MEKYGPQTFGDLNADEYDVRHDPGTTDLAVETLAELAAGGRTLELAIGTGRVGLPLAARGLEVHGVEASPKMVEKLREKPGGAAIPVLIADMAAFQLDERFDFAFLIFNTLFNLTSQDDQVQCFQCAADHLKPGGAFVIETYIPRLAEFDGGQSLRTRRVDFEGPVLEAAVHDPVRQRVDYQYVRVSNAGVTTTPLPIRYAWPAEIDLMARLAGLFLEARWGGWRKEPFTAESATHVSVYRKPV